MPGGVSGDISQGYRHVSSPPASMTVLLLLFFLSSHLPRKVKLLAPLLYSWWWFYFPSDVRAPPFPVPPWLLTHPVPWPLRLDLHIYPGSLTHSSAPGRWVPPPTHLEYTGQTGSTAQGSLLTTADSGGGGVSICADLLCVRRELPSGDADQQLQSDSPSLGGHGAEVRPNATLNVSRAQLTNISLLNA